MSLSNTLTSEWPICLSAYSKFTTADKAMVWPCQICSLWGANVDKVSATQNDHLPLRQQLLPLPRGLAPKLKNTVLHVDIAAPGAKVKIWSKEDILLVKEDHIRECLNKVDIYKPMGPDGTYPQMLKKPAEVIARPVLIIFD